jgi:hypothetical protein
MKSYCIPLRKIFFEWPVTSCVCVTENWTKFCGIYTLVGII